jgi:hypothetical protein
MRWIASETQMKIQPVANADPLNRPKQATTPLKPLADSDFAGQLNAVAGQGDSNSGDEVRASRLRPLTPIEMVPGVKGPVPPLDPLEPPSPPLLPLVESNTTFHPGNPKQPRSEHERVQEQARKWVAQTFYGTLFKQMRESPFKSDLFSGGRGGQAFTPLLDQHLADHMSRASDAKLVHAIARKLEARSASPQQAPRPGSRSINTNVRSHVAPSLRA